MNFFKVFLVAMLVFTSCKTKNVVVGASSSTKKMSARKVSKKHIATSFDKKTIEAKLKIAYRDAKNKQKISVKLRVIKDSVIWLNVTYLGIIVARAKITPSAVSYYEKMNRTYFNGSFELLKNILGTDVNFKQLQNMLLGEAIFDLKAQKYTAMVDNDAYLLLPVQQKAVFDILFWVNPIHYKLDRQELKNRNKNQELKVNYKSYSTIDGVVFPKRIEIRAIGKGKFTNIDIDYKSVFFNKNILTPFKIPKGYKQVVL
jgi:hypothetical protein